MFDRLIESVRYSELLRDGYIVPTRVLRPPTALGADLAQEPADAYFRYTKGATAFVFVSSVELAERTAERMTRGGAAAKVIYHGTHPNDRDQYIQDLKRGRIKAIVNVDTMTEGVDVPNVNAIILGRACHHTSTYLQAGGRGMRPDGKKKECVLLDLSGASYAHGRPDIDRAYSLDGNQGISVFLNEGEEIMRRANDKDRAERRESEIVGLDLVEYNEDDQRKSGHRIINWDSAGLGTATDQAIADRLGVSESTVFLARQRRGIPMFRKVINWDNVKFDKHDSELAAELGCSKITVAHARKKRKIPIANSKARSRIDWDSVALGTKNDGAIAAELGCSVQSVYYARQKRGIEACLYQQVIARGGVPPKHRGGAAKKLDFSRQPLGEIPDAEIAKRLECSVRSVKMARQTLGIPAFSFGADRRIDLSKAPLGKKSDAEVARMFKCSEHRVWQERQNRGIKSFSPRNAPNGSGGPRGKKPEQPPIKGKAGERWRVYADTAAE
jgi:DNA-binding CsgD family transcriptional regulator